MSLETVDLIINICGINRVDSLPIITSPDIASSDGICNIAFDCKKQSTTSQSSSSETMVAL